MRVLRSRRGIAALALIVLAAAAVAAIAAMQSHKAFDALPELKRSPHALQKGGDPDAQTRIDAHTANLGGPDSWAAQHLAQLAYPASSLKASTLASERKTFADVNGRGSVKGGSWQLAGPQTATEPAVLNFFDFQQADFQVSGRVTSLAVDPSCNLTSCRLWLAAAGGGVWRTDNALAATPSWTYLSGSFGINAIGTLTYDAASHTLYAGTGEPNASGDSEAGVGIYASTDGGDSWTILPGSVDAMHARSISSIVVDPNHPGTLYVGTTRGVRGVSAVTGGAVSLAPDAAPWGLWKSTDGGQHFTFIWDGHASPRGVNHVELDPTHATIYAAAFQQGIWRSTDGGSTWEQVFATQDAGDNAARTEFALNWTRDGHTRIYVGDGGTETDTAFPPHANTGVYRGDAIDTKTSAALTDGTTNPGFVALTDPTKGRADPTYDYCSGQCWYDNYVVSPAGHPDMVYIGGSFDYNLYAFLLNSGRAVLLSQDAGATWTDQTRDVDFSTGIHPDQHALVVDPANPLLFFEGSDGGIVHSSGALTDASENCTLGVGPYSTTCQELLSAVPTHITTINAGLSTLQFQGIATHGSTVIGGTQDNGTWLGTAGAASWNQTIYGDGGVAAFDASNPAWAMNEFFGVATDVNFENGDPTKWVIVSGPLAQSHEGSEFYKPQIGDPVVSGTSFVGLQSVWRTQDFGGDKTYLEANCPEFSVSFAQPGCGDFVALGSPSDLTGTGYGSDRAGGAVSALARATSDHSTLWAATAGGRVFVSKNADNPTASSVTFTRIDNTSPAAPQRFVSAIAVDPTNPNRAWLTYSGYNENTPSTPGHVFQVTFDPVKGKATWDIIELGNGNGQGNGSLGDLPVTAIARDSATGTLYIGTDFGVLANAPNGAGKYNGPWRPAAAGMPQVEITDLKVDAATHTLYAATHGRAIWQLPIG